MSRLSEVSLYLRARAAPGRTTQPARVGGVSNTCIHTRWPDKSWRMLSAVCLTNLYRGTSLIRDCHLVGPYRGTMLGLLWRSRGGAAVSYERSSPVSNRAGAPEHIPRISKPEVYCPAMPPGAHTDMTTGIPRTHDTAPYLYWYLAHEKTGF